MATKSILKNISITERRQAKRLLLALENVKNKQSKTVKLKRSLEDVRGKDIRDLIA